MEYEPIFALFNVLSLYLEARIQIRIDSDKQNQDPGPNQDDTDPQNCF
jgi:hypothetical protein